MKELPPTNSAERPPLEIDIITYDSSNHKITTYAIEIHVECFAEQVSGIIFLVLV